MKNITLLLSVLLIGNCFAGRRKITQNIQKPQSIGLEKVICKTLVERVTKKGKLLRFVDSETCDVGTQFPIAWNGRAVIDWPRLMASVTHPGKILDSMDREIELRP